MELRTSLYAHVKEWELKKHEILIKHFKKKIFTHFRLARPITQFIVIVRRQCTYSRWSWHSTTIDGENSECIQVSLFSVNSSFCCDFTLYDVKKMNERIINKLTQWYKSVLLLLVYSKIENEGRNKHLSNISQHWPWITTFLASDS